MTLQKEHSEEVEVKIFLLDDAVFCIIPYQNTPTGYDNLERMLKPVIAMAGR